MPGLIRWRHKDPWQYPLRALLSEWFASWGCNVRWQLQREKEREKGGEGGTKVTEVRGGLHNQPETDNGKE